METLTAAALDRVVDGLLASLRKRSKERDDDRLAVRYLSLILHEMRHNLGAMAVAPDQDVRTPPLVFGLWDALYADLVRLLPVPHIMAELQVVVADLKAWNLIREEDYGRFAGHYVILFGHTDYLRRYRVSRELLRTLGQKVFGDAWQIEEPLLLPDDLESPF